MNIKFIIERTPDFRQIIIRNNGSDFGGMEDQIAGFSLKIWSKDKDTVYKEVVFTELEKKEFIEYRDLRLSFSDERLWGFKYAEDGFYTCVLSILAVSGDRFESATEAFDSFYYMKHTVLKAVSEPNVEIRSYFEANPNLVGSLTVLWQLEYLSSIISHQREYRWRKLYDFLVWNYYLIPEKIST